MPVRKASIKAFSKINQLFWREEVIDTAAKLLTLQKSITANKHSIFVIYTFMADGETESEKT